MSSKVYPETFKKHAEIADIEDLPIGLCKPTLFCPRKELKDCPLPGMGQLNSLGELMCLGVFDNYRVFVYDNANKKLNRSIYPLPITKVLKKPRQCVHSLEMTDLLNVRLGVNDVVVGDLNDCDQEYLSPSVLAAIKSNPDTLFVLLSANHDRVERAIAEIAHKGLASPRIIFSTKPLRRSHIEQALADYKSLVSNRYRGSRRFHTQLQDGNSRTVWTPPLQASRSLQANAPSMLTGVLPAARRQVTSWPVSGQQPCSPSNDKSEQAERNPIQVDNDRHGEDESEQTFCQRLMRCFSSLC